jgi:PhzF family phenazine biosynthesis protein
MSEYRFWQVDAFSRERYQGNPAAVVFEADGLEYPEMQRIARQMNLSETVFLCRPTLAGADYRVRIFTPRSELPFAGHPTVAAAHAFASSTGVSYEGGRTLTQECAIGLVPVELSSHEGSPLFTVSMGEASRRPANVNRGLAARMLGCGEEELADAPVEVSSVGLPWMIVACRTLAGLSGALPDLVLIETVCRKAEAIGLTAYCPEAQMDGCELHVRSFAPGEGIPEDPACGSGNGAAAVHVAAHLRNREERFAYAAEQGLEVQRRAILRLSVASAGESPSVRLGGHAVTVMEGVLFV